MARMITVTCLLTHGHSPSCKQRPLYVMAQSCRRTSNARCPSLPLTYLLRPAARRPYKNIPPFSAALPLLIRRPFPPPVHSPPNMSEGNVDVDVNALVHNVEKLTGSRRWLRRVTKKQRWKQKRLTLTRDAIISYRDPSGHHLKSFVLIPASARLATVQEQLDNHRPYIFVLTAIPASQVVEQRPDRHVIFFAVSSPTSAKQWISAANTLAANRVRSTHGPLTPLNAPLLAAWGHVPRLPLAAVPQTARAIGLKISVDQFQQTVYELHQTLGTHITFPFFVNAVLAHAQTKALSPVFQQFSTDGQPLTAAQLSQLLQCTTSDALHLLKLHHTDHCSLQTLTAMLHHPINSVVDSQKAKQPHDMTRPLTHYLISSSHNTYLESDQFKGDSTAEMYRIVLERACRCVEIDMWDGDDDQPAVTHGRTMTSVVSLRKVLCIIREHAFSHGTDYPLILSLENHLSHRQQVNAADLIREILGDCILTPEYPGMHVDVLPSPEQLRGRILIKAKTGHSVRVESKPTDTCPVYDDDSDEADTASASARSRDDENPSSSSESEKGSKNGTTSKISEEIASLVYLPGSSRKDLMRLWNKGISGKDRFISSSCVSVNEKKVAEIWENNKVDTIREYNTHALSRVYPKGTRVDSSNYTPTLAHFMGCQIVALNWQKHDSGLAVNEARFLANSGCGYILSESVRSPTQSSGVLSIQLLSGFLLPKPKNSSTRDTIDPYCVINVYDEQFDEEDDFSSERFYSQADRSNGFAPTWHETATLKIRNKALAVVVLKVYDHDRTSDDDLIGYCAVPTSLIREGHRCFPLTSKDGDPLTLPSTDVRPSVLCNVKWT